MYEDFSEQSIRDHLEKIFQPQVATRKVILRTGPGGADLFEEAVERGFGFERIYLGKKFPRILRKLPGRISKSHSGRYYRLRKTK
jgi:hypothetical protein